MGPPLREASEKPPKMEEMPTKIIISDNLRQGAPALLTHNWGAHPENAEGGINQQGTDIPHGHASDIRPEAAGADDALDSSDTISLSSSFSTLLAIQTQDLQSCPAENGHRTPQSQSGIDSSTTGQAYAVEGNFLVDLQPPVSQHQHYSLEPLLYLNPAFPTSNERSTRCHPPPSRLPTTWPQQHRIVQMFIRGASLAEIGEQQRLDMVAAEEGRVKAEVLKFAAHFGEVPLPTKTCDHVTKSCNSCLHIPKARMPDALKNSCLERANGITDYKDSSYFQDQNSTEFVKSLYPGMEEISKKKKKARARADRRLERSAKREELKRKNRERAQKRAQERAQERAQTRGQAAKSKKGKGGTLPSNSVPKARETPAPNTPGTANYKYPPAADAVEQEHWDQSEALYSPTVHNVEARSKLDSRYGSPIPPGISTKFEPAATPKAKPTAAPKAKPASTPKARPVATPGTKSKSKPKTPTPDLSRYIPRRMTRSRGGAELAGGISDDGHRY